MEQYTERQKEVFQRFYEQCKSKGFNPEKGEADKQRAVILAESSKDLKVIFKKVPDGADVITAYRVGADRVREKENAKQSADKAAELAKQREKDAAFADIERKISELRGRDKRSFFVEQTVSRLSGWYSSLHNQQMAVAETVVALSKAQSQSESSWGTLGGIAAGITGSTAVGAAVAADTMAKNERIREKNQEILDRNSKSMQPEFERLNNEEMAVNSMKRSAESRLEQVKFHLVSEPGVEELMQQIEFGQPQYNFQQDQVMIIRIDACAKSSFRVAESTPAVIDGSFLAEVYSGDTCVGRAYLNIPRDGMSKDVPVTLYGHAMAVPNGSDYTVAITPIALWLIEVYAFNKHTARVYGEDRHTIEQEVCDLPELCGFHFSEQTWKTIALSSKPWQKRYAELPEEAKREAIAAAKKVKKEKRKKVGKKVGKWIYILVIVPTIVFLVEWIVHLRKIPTFVVLIIEALVVIIEFIIIKRKRKNKS